MKNKIVVWGTNEAEEKVLIALELQPDTNKVMLYTFPETIAPEEFVNEMMNTWRADKGTVEFPEGHSALERPLSVADSLLPDHLKVERGDVINRAQTEWHFVVLSTKLHKAYQEELAELKERVSRLGSYDNNLWDELKGFWDKVQEQSRDRNLFRDHADNLRDETNALFEDLKKLRSKLQSEFMEVSQQVFDELNEKMDQIDKKIQAGGGKLGAIFDELKNIQRDYRDAKLSNEHRNKVWNRIDAAFKAAKERRFGPAANEGSVAERHERRLQGLNEAIKRMEGNVKRDEDELNFQRKKIAATEGQLEAQIREAKIKMVEERLNSKREKLNEMYQTRQQVERQIIQSKDKEERRQKMEEAKKVAKEAIAAEVKTSVNDTPKAETATPPADEPEEKGDGLFESLGNVLEETLEDVSDTVQAVASVLGEKAEVAARAAMAKASELLDDLRDQEEEKSETPTAEPAAEAPAAEAVAETPAAEPAAETPAVEPVAEIPAAEPTTSEEGAGSEPEK
jgi:chromosome segregation ATPase